MDEFELAPKDPGSWALGYGTWKGAKRAPFAGEELRLRQMKLLSPRSGTRAEPNVPEVFLFNPRPRYLRSSGVAGGLVMWGLAKESSNPYDLRGGTSRTAEGIKRRSLDCRGIDR